MRIDEECWNKYMELRKLEGHGRGDRGYKKRCYMAYGEDAGNKKN